VTVPRRQAPVARGRSTARASCVVTAVYTTSPPPSADAEDGGLLAQGPQALCLRRVHGPRPDAAQFLRVGGHAGGDVAVLAVDPTEGVELAADRAPDRRRRALLDRLHVLSALLEGGDILGGHELCKARPDGPGMHREGLHAARIRPQRK